MPGVVERTNMPVDPYGTSLSGKVSRAFDNTLSMLFPSWGESRKNTRFKGALMRQRAEQLGVSWTKPNVNRDGKWIETGFSIDAILDLDIIQLQNRCSELFRTNSVAHAAVEGRIANEIGAGIKVQSRVREKSGDASERSKSINMALETKFLEWSEAGVDEKRSIGIYEFERLAGRSLAIYGEAIIVVSETPSSSGITLTLECIAPERLSTPPEKESDDNCTLGVQKRSNGTIDGYWIRDSHPGDPEDYTYTWTFYSRYDRQGQPRVLHAFERMFPGQSRGIPWLAPAMDRIKDLDDWCEAELIAKQIEACFGLIFKAGDTATSAYETAANYASAMGINGQQLEELSPGMIHYANAGEEVSTIDPQRPGATYAPFVESTLRFIAAAINLPYEILAKNYFRTTFSSGQLAMLDGRHGFKTRRQILIDGILVSIWGRFVNDAVFLDEADGTIPIEDYVLNRRFYNQGVWTPPGWGFINPRDEVRAATEALDADIITLSTLYSERGEDADVQLAKRQEEKLKQTAEDVERRKLQWDLEEAAGLPHAEEPVQDTSNDDSTETETSSQTTEEQTADSGA